MINLADCTDFDGWTFGNWKYLEGRAQDASGAEISDWAYDMYPDLNSAKRACLLLNRRRFFRMHQSSVQNSTLYIIFLYSDLHTI